MHDDERITADRSPGATLPGARLEALFASARDEHRAGRFAQAGERYRQVLDAVPEHPEALHLLGVLALQQGDTAVAVSLITHSLAVEPEASNARNNLGNALRAGGRFEDALEAFDTVIATDPELADAHYNRGVTLQSMGRAQDAQRAYARALELDPKLAEAHANSGSLGLARGDAPAALVAFTAAVELRPEAALSHYNLGLALRAGGDLDAALRAFVRSVELAPRWAMARFNLGTCLRELGKHEQAGAELLAASEIDPNLVEAQEAVVAAMVETGDTRLALARSNLGTALLAQGRAGEAWTVFEENLRAPGLNTRDLSHGTLALAESKGAAAAAHLLDFSTLVKVTRHGAPAEFETLAAFNAALARHITEHPSLSDDPEGHATRSGQHTGELLVEPKGPMVHLETLIRREVSAYMHGVAADTAHPLHATCPHTWGLTVWSVVLGAQGHQMHHIHPDAWLTGIYYVEVPQAVRSGADRQAGWVEFGAPDPRFPLTVEFERHAVPPAPGMLVLFPSYVYHRTIPFDTGERRISVAFDVLPVLRDGR